MAKKVADIETQVPPAATTPTERDIAEEQRQQADFLERQRLEEIAQARRDAEAERQRKAQQAAEQAQQQQEQAGNAAAELMRPLTASERAELTRLEGLARGEHRLPDGRVTVCQAGRVPISTMKRLGDLRKRSQIV